MNTELTREHCMSLPHATENVQWGADLCFKIGGKMFAVMALEPSDHLLSFKCTPESFVELQEIEGIVPAPYMARAQWVSLQRWSALRDEELRDLLRTAYELVFAKLTKKAQQELRSGSGGVVGETKNAVKKKTAKKSTTKRAKVVGKKAASKKVAKRQR
jgi:predicted DNA-binding protein (MmcQ/YjbR family)